MKLIEAIGDFFGRVDDRIDDWMGRTRVRSDIPGDEPVKKIRAVFSRIVGGINYLGLASCFVMVFVVAFDVILRKLSNASVSIKGSNEFAAYFMVVIVMLAIPTLRITKGHVHVSMFVDKFPPRFRLFWMGGVQIIELVVFAMLTYGGVLKLQNFLSTGTTTDVLNMPKWPFALVCLIGFAEMTVFMLLDTVQTFMDAAHYKPEPEAEGE